MTLPRSVLILLLTSVALITASYGDPVEGGATGLMEMVDIPAGTFRMGGG